MRTMKICLQLVLTLECKTIGKYIDSCFEIYFCFFYLFHEVKIHVSTFLSRHRHSFIGNNFEKVSRNESNLARYQTSVALDQMECNSSIDSTMNSLDTKRSGSEETINPDICTDNSVNDNSSDVNIVSNCDQSLDKFMQKVAILLSYLISSPYLYTLLCNYITMDKLHFISDGRS